MFNINRDVFVEQKATIEARISVSEPEYEGQISLAWETSALELFFLKMNDTQSNKKNFVQAALLVRYETFCTYRLQVARPETNVHFHQYPVALTFLVTSDWNTLGDDNSLPKTSSLLPETKA